MPISDIKFQNHVLSALQSGLSSDRLAHAYIFSGPEGVGKSLTAREFAKLVLCEDPQTIDAPTDNDSSWRDSCGRCESCRVFAAGTHGDFHLIYKELITLIPGKERHKATELGIDVVRRELIEKVQLRPTLGRAKVFVVLETHRMSRSAQNALLKTLEEPPSGTYIILVSESLGGLLSTIKSRAPVLQFGPISDEFVCERLAQAGADVERQRFFTRLVPGQLGLALELFQQGVYDLNEVIGRGLATLTPAKVDDLAKEIQEQAGVLAGRIQEYQSERQDVKGSDSELNRTALRRIVGLIGSFFDDALRRKLGLGEGETVNEAGLEIVDGLADRYDVDQLQQKIADIRQAQTYLDSNVNQGLLLSQLLSCLAVRGVNDGRNN